MKKYIIYALIVVLVIGGIAAFIIIKNNKANNNENSNTIIQPVEDKDYYEKAIEFVKKEITKTEDHINTKEGYHKFAIYEGFGVAKENGVTYAYMHIGDMSYYLENGKVEQGSGSSMAYKVKFVNDEPVSYENPVDGAGQEEDYKRLFPADIYRKMFMYNFDFSKIEDLAKEYYKN